MAKAKRAKKASGTKADKLKFYHHPYSDTYYGAYGPDRVRVKRGAEWGEFNREGHWIEGPIRYADPCFCHWVTGEFIFNGRLLTTKNKVWPLTRLARSKNLT